MIWRSKTRQRLDDLSAAVEGERSARARSDARLTRLEAEMRATWEMLAANEADSSKEPVDWFFALKTKLQHYDKIEAAKGHSEKKGAA